MGGGRLAGEMGRGPAARGTGAGAGRPGKQLRGVERFPDLGVLGGDVARPAGGFHHFGVVHSHSMAQIGALPG